MTIAALAVNRSLVEAIPVNKSPAFRAAAHLELKLQRRSAAGFKPIVEAGELLLSQT